MRAAKAEGAVEAMGENGHRPGKFKKGGIVRVVTPLAFVRCGYPLDPGEVNERMAIEHAQRIRGFLNLDGRVLPPDGDGPYEEWIDPRARLLATRALASQYLAEQGFGGKKRRIHTQEMPEIKGKLFKVTGWQFNKTGDYYPPNNWPGSWDSPPEYEPGGLANEKTHKILHLEYMDGSFRHLKIEACHVATIESTTP